MLNKKIIPAIKLYLVDCNGCWQQVDVALNSKENIGYGVTVCSLYTKVLR